MKNWWKFYWPFQTFPAFDLIPYCFTEFKLENKTRVWESWQGHTTNLSRWSKKEGSGSGSVTQNPKRKYPREPQHVCLPLTLSKTKELVVDFRKHKQKNLTALIVLYKKDQSRRYLTLGSFGVQGALLWPFMTKRVWTEWKKAGSVLSCSLEPGKVVGDLSMDAKLLSWWKTRPASFMAI